MKKARFSEEQRPHEVHPESQNPHQAHNRYLRRRRQNCSRTARTSLSLLTSEHAGAVPDLQPAKDSAAHRLREALLT
jgi:hypothetical protein